MSTKHKCPVCQARYAAADPDISFAFGIIFREVIPMDRLAPLLCEEHEVLMLSLWEMLVDQTSKKAEAEDIVNILVPDKDVN